MPHEDYWLDKGYELALIKNRQAAVDDLRQQLDGWIAANSPNGWIDNLRQQLSTLKAELKCIGEAIDDPRTDLTMTMSEVIIEFKQQLAAALAACKAKDDIILEVLECESTTRPPIRLREALAIQPDDSALKAWLGETVAYRYCYQGQDICLSLEPQDAQIPVSYYWQEPLYAPKGM